MRLLGAGIAFVWLLPVAVVMFLSGLVCLALRALHVPFYWLYGRCQQLFRYIESWAT